VRHQREREIDQREAGELRADRRTGLGRPAGGKHRHAEIVRLDVQVHDVERVQRLEHAQRVMRQRPPVATVGEHVGNDASVTLQREQRHQVLDRHARVERLQRVAARSGSSERGSTAHAATCKIGDDPRFARCPPAEVACCGREEPLRVSAPLAGGRRFASHLDVRTGRHSQPRATEDDLDGG
jgi:hypothetical protein